MKHYKLHNEDYFFCWSLLMRGEGRGRGSIEEFEGRKRGMLTMGKQCNPVDHDNLVNKITWLHCWKLKKYEGHGEGSFPNNRIGVGYVSVPPIRRRRFGAGQFGAGHFGAGTIRCQNFFFRFVVLKLRCFGLQLASLALGLRTLVSTGSRSTAFKGIFSGGFFPGGFLSRGFYPGTRISSVLFQ